MRNWRQTFPYDRAKNWLLSLGRSGRLERDESKKDVKPPVVETRGGGQKPVTAFLQTEQDAPMTRARAIELEGFQRYR